MKRKSLFNWLPFRFAALVAPLIAAWPMQSRAATVYWDPGLTPLTPSGGGPATWDTITANWSDLAVDGLWPNTTADTAVFGTVGGAVTVAAGGVTAGTLQFDVTGYTIGGAAITLGGTPTLTVTNAGNLATINSAITAGGSPLTVNGAGNLTITTGLDNGSAAALTKAGAGNLTLSAASTRTGTTQINGGTISAGTLSSLGTGDVTATSGTLAYTGTAGDWVSNVILDGGTFSQTQNGNLSLAAGKAITVNATGGTLDVSGPAGGSGTKILLNTAGQLTGSGTFTKTGAGTLQLTSANTGFTGNAIISAGFVEAQNIQALGTTPGNVTVGGTGEFVTSALNWTGAITANAGGAISGDNGNSIFSGAITANGNFFARARDFYSTGTGRTLTVSGNITGAGGMIAQGPTAGIGRVLLTGNNAGVWTGGLQVDPFTQAVASIGIGTGAAASLGSGDLTLNGGRLTLTPAIGTGLATTAGVSGRWITNVGNLNDTFLTPWLTAPTANTRIDAALNVPNQAQIDPITGLPGTSGGGLNLPVPLGAGLANGVHIDRYAAVYNGLLTISPTGAGAYTFTLASDDGSSLFIDGQQVVADEGGHGIGTIGTGTVTLTAGPHQITVKNTNGGTGGGLQVAYQGPDQPVAATTGGTGITNMGVAGLPAGALSNVTGGLIYAMANNIVVPNQGAATTTTLETGGFDTNSAGTMTVGTNGTILFSSATSHTFTQDGNVTLGAGSGLLSASQAITVPLATTLTAAKVIVNGAVTLAGNTNFNADATGLLTVNGVIDDGAGTFGITKNGGAGTVILGGTGANTFDGPFNMAQGVLLLNKTGANAIGAGGLNLDTSIATGTAAIDYALVRLMANEQIADGSTLNVLTHNTVGYGATLDLNGFTETVGAVNVRGATTNMGRIVTGPGGKLIVGGNITMENNRNAAGNTGRETLITSVAPASNSAAITTYGGGTLDLGAATRTITVNSTVAVASTDGTIDTVITGGAAVGIIKAGGQRLILNGSNPTTGSHSTFSGGVVLNDGVLRAGGGAGQTSSVLGTGPLTVNKGLTTASGGIAAGAATLELRNNGAGINTLIGGTLGANFVGQSVNNVVNYGNAVTVAGTVPVFGVDVNNTPTAVLNPTGGTLNTLTGSGAELRLGTLTTAAALQLNVTGGNNYSAAFNGISLTGALTVNAIGANLRLNNLSGAQNITTAATNTGNLIIGGNGAGYSGTVNVAAGGTIRLAPAVGAANNLFGTGTLTTAANPTIGISPVMEGATLTAGTPGGLTARYYQMATTSTGINATNFGQVPSGVLTVGTISDAAITNRPPTVTATSFAQGIVVYSGLLNISAGGGGNYTFQTFADDGSQLVVDGIPVVSISTGLGSSGILHSPVSTPINLTAGLHTIAFKVQNAGGGGGAGVSFNGPDSGGVMRPIPSSSLQSAGLLTNVANSGINQSIAAAGTLTLDGGGTDLDGGINNLAFAGATGTLNVTNIGGIGITTVSGVTAVGANTATLNPTTGTIGLIGDVTGGGIINKTGAGMLIMAGAKTFTGAININNGSAQVTNPLSLGTAAGATTVASGAVLDLNGTALGAEPLNLSGAGIAAAAGLAGAPAALWNSASGAASASGPITLLANTAIGGLGDITLSGPQTGNFTLTKIGPDTLTLSGASTNTAAYTVSAGFLKVNNATALGTTAGTTTVSAGAVLDLNGNSIAEPLNVIGAGTTNYGSMNSLGSLINTGAAVTHSGAVTLGGAASIGSNSLGAGGDITLSASMVGAQPLTKVGGNTLTLTAANTAVNAMNINFGTLLMSGAGTSSGGNWTVNPTATVTLNNTGTATGARLGARAVNLVGGNLNIIGFNGVTAVTEALGANNLTASSNRNVVTLTPNATVGNGGVSLSSGNTLARGSNGTILFRGTNLGNAAAGTANTANIAFGGTAQTIGQFGADNSKNRAIIPWAVMDTNASGDGSSFVKIGTNGVMALNLATEFDIDAFTGPNNILQTTAAALAAPGGSTLVNSLNFAGAGGIAIAAGSTLQLDSGAIGALTSSTLSGGTLQAGISQSNNLRELVAYTAGAGTNLTVSSVIASSLPGLNVFGPNTSPNFINRASLTKDGLGKLTLQAQNTFIGSVRINGGTVVLDGGDNRILFQTPTAPALGAVAATLNSGNLIVNAGGTLDLNGTSQRVGGLASNLAAVNSALPGQGGVITNNSTATDSTLYITQGAAFITPASINHSAVVGAQNLNVVREGGFTLTLTAPNTYRGTTTINGGLTILQDGATLSGTSGITINRAVLRQDDAQTIQTPNRLPTTIPITLNGGALTFVGRGGGTQNAFNVANGAGGSLTVGSGPALLQATMAANANANGAGDARVNVGNINRAAGSGTLSFNSIQSGNQNMGDNPRFFLSQINTVPIPAAGVTMLPAWITVAGFNPASAQGGTSGSINNITANTTDFAQYDPATGLRPVLYTSVLAPGNNVNFGASTILPVGNTLINSLRLEGATTLTFGGAGYDTLNLQSGGLLSTFNNSARVIGNERNAGNLTAGGVAPAAPQELFIYNSANTLTVNARIINNPDGSPVSLVLGGAGLGGTISLNGTNTYSGTTYVNGVNLTLNNTVGVAIPGNIIASGGTSNGSESQNPTAQTITLAASNQIAPTATITLNGGTALNLNNNAQSIANLVFAADGGSFGNQGPTVSTGTGTLTLTGNVTATNLQQATTIPVMQGNLSLAAGSHTFNVGTFPNAPGAVGFVLNSTLSGAGILDKSGAGILGLGGNNAAYTSAVNVNAGAVQFTSNNSSIGSTITLTAGTTLSAGGFVGSVGALGGSGTVNSTFGTLAQAGGQVNVGVGNTNSSFGGLVTGVVAMGKVGTGDFSLTNTANDYTGGTLVNGGTLTLAGAGLNTSGSGLLSVNNTGTLQGSGSVNGGLRFNSGSAVNFTLGAVPGPAPIDSLASVSSLGQARVNIAGTPAAGTYPLINYGGAAVSASALAGLRLGTTPGGGLLYGLVHDAAGTSVNLSVEAVNASKTWSGHVNGTWDTATNNFSLYNEGEQVVFNNAGYNKTITGGARTPQAITVTNSGLCNDYSIANPIGGALAGGLNKSGSGLVQLTGNNTFGGGVNVTGGTVRASVSSASNSLGSGSVTLSNGTTLQLDPVANTGTAGITGRYFNQASNANTLANMHFQLPAVTTQTDPGVPNVVWTAANRPANAQVGVIVGTGWESFGAQWLGKLNVTAAGPYSFFTNSDDATRVFIDGIQVNNNDGGKGNTEAGATTFLNIGLHDVRFEFLQGTGGAQAGLSWQGPGIAKANIPASSLFTAENVAGGFADNNINIGNNVSVSGTANLNLSGSQFTSVQIGSLTLPAASTLNVSANAGKQLRAAGTFLSGGTATLNSSADLNLGQITDGGTATTLIKQGVGRWTLDNTNPVSTGQSNVLSAGTVLEIQGGKLAVVGQNAAALPLLSTNPLGSASVRLNGGGLSLDTKQGAVTFDNAVLVSQSSTIEASPSSGVGLTLGSGSNGIALASGTTLTVDLFGGARSGAAANNTQVGAGASLILAGAISSTGTGNLLFRSPQTNMGQYPVYGTATLNANNTVAGTTTINGGYAFQNITNPLIVTLNGNGRLSGSTGIVLNQSQLTIDDSATVNTGRINATTAAPLTLRASSLNLLTSTTANSGETFAAVTADSGWNRIILQNQAGAGFTGLFTGGSLVRNNRAAIQFQGSSLGVAGAGTNASLVRFTTAPTLLGGGGAAASATISTLSYAVGATDPGTNPPTYYPVTHAANGIRPISAAGETVASAAAVVANANVRDSIGAAAAPVPSTNDINTYTLNNTANAAFTATLTTNPLNFSATGAGLLLATATNGTQSALTIAGTAINFKGAEGHIIVTNTAGLTINSVIQGTNGLTVSGNNNINTNSLQQLSGGSLTLTADNSPGLTGTVTINGRLVLNSTTTDLPLGNASNPVQFGGGTLVFNNAGSTLAATRTVTMLPNTFGVIDTNGNADTIAGPVTGAGGLVKISGGRLSLINAGNNYSGPTTVYQGDLTTSTGPQGNILLSGNVSNLTFAQTTSGTYAGNISGLGSLTITANAGNIITLGDPADATKGVNTYGGGTTFGNANAVTLRGTTSSLVGGIVTQAGGIVTEQNFNGTASNVISGPATFLKAGTGAVTVVNASSYSGATTISAGSLIAATDSLSATNGAFGNSAGAIVLGDANTTTNNSAVGLFTGGAVTIGRAITIANQATSGGYTIGGAVDANSTISGAISTNQSFNLTQVNGSLTNALNVTGGISSANAGSKMITMTGGKINILTNGISDGAGQVSTTVTAGIVDNFANNTYTGTTTVNGGILYVDGSIATSSMTTVNSGGTLGGYGTVGPLTVNTGGTFAPGHSPGILNTGSVVTNLGSTTSIEVGGLTPGSLWSNHDQARTTGTVTLDSGSNAGTLVVSLVDGYLPAVNDSFFIWLNDGLDAISGTFNGLPEGAYIPINGNNSFQISYLANGDAGAVGNDISLTYIPEPGSAALAAAAAALALSRRRRRA